jgi:hypothetical protein
MKLKKSSGSKMSKARREIADQIQPGPSTGQMVGMVVGAIVTVAIAAFAITSMMTSEEQMK